MAIVALNPLAAIAGLDDASAQVTCPTITSNSSAAVFASFSPDGAPTSCTQGLTHNLVIAVDGGSAVNGTSGFTASIDGNASFIPAVIESGPCFTDSSVFTNLVKPTVATGQAYSCGLRYDLTIAGLPYTLLGTFRGTQYSTATAENFRLVSGAAAPELDVRDKSNSVDISDGDTTPSLTDETDYGSVTVGGQSDDLFIVQNNGTGTLVFQADALAISDTANFTIFQDLADNGSVPAVGTPADTTRIFGIRFNPTSPGLKTATVTIRSNDSDEDPYTFLIQGAGVAVGAGAVRNPYSGTYAAWAQDNVAFNSDNTAGANDRDRGYALALGSSCGNNTGSVDNTPDAPPAGHARSHDVDGPGGASGVVTSLTYHIPGFGNDQTQGRFCLYLDSGGGYWSIDRTQTGATAALTPCAPESLFSPTSGCTLPDVGVGPSVKIVAPAQTRGPFRATVKFSEGVKGFRRGDLTVGNGRARALTGTDGDKVYKVLIIPKSQGNVTIDIAEGVARDMDGNLNSKAVQTVTNFFDRNFVRARTQRVISNFMSRRADQLTASDPSLVNRLAGSGGTPSTGAMNLSGGGTLDNNQVAFSTSLRQIVSASLAAREKRGRGDLEGMMGLGQASLPNPYGGGVPSFDLWLQGHWARADSDVSQSDIGLLYVGADYRFSTSFLVGVMAQFDRTVESDGTAGQSAEGDGWMAGPYLVARLHDNLIFDARGAWGRSDNNVSPFGTYKDSFDTDRWLLRAQLTGDFQFGAVRFTPHIGILKFEETQAAYTDSLGVYIPGQTVSLGRLTFGPAFSARLSGPSGITVVPQVGLKGIYDFDEAAVVDLASGLAIGTDDIRARLEGGISIEMPNGWNLQSEAFYDGIGVEQFEAYGGSLKLSVPLN